MAQSLNAQASSLTPQASPKRPLGDRILSAGFALLLAHLCLKLCGVLTKNIIPNNFGFAVSDVFDFVYSTILMTAFSFGEQCFSPALIPIFTRAWEKEGEARAWRYLSIIFNLQFIILFIITLVLFLFTQPIIGALTQWKAPTLTLTVESGQIQGELLRVNEAGFKLLVGSQEQDIPYKEIKNPVFSEEDLNKFRNVLERRELSGQMLPYIAPGLLGMSLASLTYGILIGYRKSMLFFFAGFGDTVLRLCIFLGALLGAFIGKGDWRFITAGAVAGGTGKLVTHLFALGRQRLRLYRFSLNLRDPYVVGFFLLVLPLLVGIFISSIRDLVIKNVLTSQAGLPTYYSQGKGIVDSLSFLMPFTLSIALLPFFCDLAAREDNKQLGEVLTRTIRLLLWFFVPVTIVMAVAAFPICYLVYAGPEMTSERVRYPAMVMQLFALQMPFATLEMMVMQAFFSNRRLVAPTLAGIVFSILTATLAYTLVIGRKMDNPFQILLIVSLCVVLAKAFKACVLVALLKRTVPVLPMAETAGFIGKLVVAGTAAAGAAYSAAWLYHGPLGLNKIMKNQRASNLGETLLVGLACAAGYLAFCILLKMAEPRLFWQWTIEKFKRRGSPPDVPSDGEAAA